MQNTKYDTVIIGSGVGGLSCASSLLKTGSRVLVLEMEDEAGGAMRSYMDPGADKWSWTPGVQWVCGYSERTTDYILLHELTDGTVSFSPLDYECQIKYFPDLDYQYTFVNNRDDNIRRLKAEFPEEAEKITRYFKYVEAIDKKSDLFSMPKMFGTFLAKFMFWFSKVFKILPFMDKSFIEVLENVIGVKDERLKALLSSFAHYFGVSLNKIPFPFYAYGQNIQFNGMFFPDGGSQTLAEALLKSIRDRGGVIETGKSVKRIIIKKNKATGVETDKGEIIYAGNIVSAIGIRETLDNLIREGERPDRLVKSLKSHESILSYLLLLVGFEGDISSFGIKKTAYKTLRGDPSTISRDPTEED